MTPRARILGIIDEVATRHGFERSDLLVQCRTPARAAARHEATYRLWSELNLSYPRVARAIGMKDHASAIHAVRVHKARMAQTENAA